MSALKRVRAREAVLVGQEHGIAGQGRRVGAEERHRDHVGRVLHEPPDGPVVGMVVVRTMAEDDVGLPFANEPGDRAPVLQRRLELAVVDVEHLRGDAEDLRGLLHLGGAPARERAAGLAPVPDVAVGDRDELT